MYDEEKVVLSFSSYNKHYHQLWVTDVCRIWNFLIGDLISLCRIFLRQNCNCISKVQKKEKNICLMDL